MGEVHMCLDLDGGFYPENLGNVPIWPMGLYWIEIAN